MDKNKDNWKQPTGSAIVAPYYRASFFSKLTYWWLNPLVQLARKRKLNFDDIWQVPYSDAFQANNEIFQKLWKHELKVHGRQKASIGRVLVKAIRKRLLFTVLFYCLVVALQVTSSLLVQQLVSYSTSTSSSVQMGIILVLSMFASEAVISMILPVFWYYSIRTGIKIRSMVFGFVFSKIIKLKSVNSSSVGQLINLCANDAQRIFESAAMLGICLAIPITMISVFAVMIYLIGPAIMAKAIKQLRKKSIVSTDRRERAHLEKVSYIQSFNISYLTLVPTISSIVLFTVSALSGINIGIAEVYTCIALLNVLRIVISIFPLMIRQWMESVVAVKRMKELLLMEEVKPRMDIPVGIHNAIAMERASFSWKLDNQQDDNKTSLKHTEFILKDINLTLKKGQLIGVCGRIGSGKSSLISAILGEMNQLSGNVALEDSIALVSQQAWIFNATLKENVVFGSDFDKNRYLQAMTCCALMDDLTTLPNGDETLIGDRGINLSGGQKQRVSLARAVYAEKEIYLLDDPLSAVDVDVGKHIFNWCIRGVLKGKSILFITHQLQYLRWCDSVIMMQDGQIVAHDNHEDLLANSKVYNDFISNLKDEEEKNAIEDAKKIKTTIPRNETVQVNDSEKENEESSAVTCKTISSYFDATGGKFVVLLVIFVYGTGVAMRVFSDWWLSQWISNGFGNNDSQTNQSLGLYTNSNHSTFFNSNATIYGSSALAIMLAYAIRAFIISKVTLRASSELCAKALYKIIRCPMSFFDTTPSGRILNRFSRDIDEIDTQLPMFIDNGLLLILTILASLIIIVVSYPWAILAIIPLMIAIGLIAVIFNQVLRELKRLDNISRSPVLSHLTATVEGNDDTLLTITVGLSVIHAHNKSQEYLAKFEKLLNKNTSCFMAFCYLNRWFAQRINWIVVGLVTVCSALVVIERGLTSSAYSGLALVYVLQIKGLLQFSIRNILQVSARLTAVERLREYSKELPIENQLNNDYQVKVSVDKKWALDHGKIEFADVQAGKTSIGTCLFRLVEICSGSILIDNRDIKSIDIYSLRSNMAMIPQDPYLFEGTVRKNLDPLDYYEDEKLWATLEKVQLKEKIANEPDQLQKIVQANGTNFSMGERQLLCLARALLKESKILLLDEATAYMDTRTDEIMQQNLRKEFSHSTVLIIAHRLNTIQSCDKIMVLHDGKIIEFDTPSKLMENPRSVFKGMVAKGGIDYAFE
ncbi:Multidrug resistance-associated protein 5 [Trichoplax sp. H2]|nr:Multidrug resistance-associated protein 5 [Trichoplax sp. H2]|eukprot:RDD40706.1 Multidrug resistance-associated protein 5 [Trichoplax sp. H2]